MLTKQVFKNELTFYATPACCWIMRLYNLLDNLLAIQNKCCGEGFCICSATTFRLVASLVADLDLIMYASGLSLDGLYST